MSELQTADKWVFGRNIAETEETAVIWVQLFDEDGVHHLANTAYTVEVPAGAVSGRTDAQGILRVASVPTGIYAIRVGIEVPVAGRARRIERRAGVFTGGVVPRPALLDLGYGDRARAAAGVGDPHAVFLYAVKEDTEWKEF